VPLHIQPFLFLFKVTATKWSDFGDFPDQLVLWSVLKATRQNFVQNELV